MEYKKLGTTDLHVSAIGFGCMSLEKETAADLLAMAVEKGINFFDTADLYQKGMNESWVGAALKPHRKKIVLATKVGNQWRDDGSGWEWNPRKKYILRAVEESLQRLQTDYIDLYQLHGGTLEDPIEETIEAFEQLQQQGKIRYYGISSIRPNVIRRWVARSKLASVMMQYSLLDRRPEESCIPLFQQNGIALLTRGALAQGLLVNKPAKEYLGHAPETVARAQEVVHSLSGPDRSAAQTALRFVLQQPEVTVAVAGIRSRQQLEDVAGTIETPHLTDTQITALRSVTALLYQDHR